MSKGLILYVLTSAQELIDFFWLLVGPPPIYPFRRHK